MAKVTAGNLIIRQAVAVHFDADEMPVEKRYNGTPTRVLVAELEYGYDNGVWSLMPYGSRYWDARVKKDGTLYDESTRQSAYLSNSWLTKDLAAKYLPTTVIETKESN